LNFRRSFTTHLLELKKYLHPAWEAGETDTSVQKAFSESFLRESERLRYSGSLVLEGNDTPQCYFDVCPDKPSSNDSNLSLVMTDDPFGGNPEECEFYAYNACLLRQRGTCNMQIDFCRSVETRRDMVLAPIPEPKIRLFPPCFEMSLIGGRAVRCKLFIKLRETVRASVFDPRSMREKVLAKKAASFRWLTAKLRGYHGFSVTWPNSTLQNRQLSTRDCSP
jgi:hypothetical protein